MRIKAVQFFQPCPMPNATGKMSVATSARSAEHDLMLEGNAIRISHKQLPAGPVVYITLFNTCWYSLEEVSSEPGTSEITPKGNGKAKSKPHPVVVE